MFWWKYMDPDDGFRHELKYLWARPSAHSVTDPWFIIRKSANGVLLSVGYDYPHEPMRVEERIVNEFPTEEDAKFAAELIGDPATFIEEKDSG